MGAEVAKPNSPPDNVAKSNADAVMQGMEQSAENFLQSCRLGTSTAEVLGYPLTDQRLTSQETRLVVQTKANSQEGDVAEAVDNCFGKDWTSVVKYAGTKVLSFLGEQAPKPEEAAVNDTFSKSFLLFENHNIVQYCIYIRRTNCTSVGDLLKDSQATMMTVLCKGNVDYASIDPQTVIYCYMASPEFQANSGVERFFNTIGDELKLAAMLLAVKMDIKKSMVGEAGELLKRIEGKGADLHDES